MADDQWTDKFVALTLAARPAPGPGFEARALAALADIRPRRHPNLLTFIIVAALILLLAAGLFAAVRHFFYVHGTLEFEVFDPLSVMNTTGSPQAIHFLSQDGRLDETAPLIADTVLSPRHSPDGDRLCFSRRDRWPPASADVFTAGPDGSDEVNLTEIAGLGGINCVPMWSTDGRKIAFTHSDPEPGQLPCRAGLSVWVMEADGSDAHWVMGRETEIVFVDHWSHSDDYLSCAQYLTPGPNEAQGVAG